MTFHTFEIGCRVKNINYIGIYSHLYEKFPTRFFPYGKNSDRWIFTGLKNRGIILSFVRRSVGYDGSEVWVYYRINPTRILESDNYVDLFHSNDASKILDLVNDITHEVSDLLPDVCDGVLERFDFCSNIVLCSEVQVKDWISLINGAFVPSAKYTQKTVCNKRAGRYEIPHNEATFTASNLVEISFYNKLHQLEAEDLPIVWHKNILRCEVRCMHSAISILKRKFGITSNREFFCSLIEIGNYVFNQRLRELGLAGTFYTLEDIRSLVSKTNFKCKTKEKMINFASASADHKSIRRAVITECIPKPKPIIKKFTELDMSPMPIPVRSSIASGTNILDLCLRYADAKRV